MSEDQNIEEITPSELIQKLRLYKAKHIIDEEVICKAYNVAHQAHLHQKRDSGEPYIGHPLAVAMILADMHLDTASIVTALLHDTAEDTDLTIKDIEKEFGSVIAHLVDGVSKLSQLEMRPNQNKQAENFRKLVLAMSTDIRVLLVKLADRLHNMHTITHISKAERRKRIATETMDIYAPLAQRIGLQWIKDELEEHAFRELNPDMHESITNRLQFLYAHSENIIHRVIEDIQKLLEENNIQGTVSGRTKAPYSIWLKMQRKHITFEQLSDIMAFRVVVANKSECYQALGILHSKFRVVPGRFKDYISTPKANQYQSIHTGLIGPMHTRIEMQIRTQEMHEIADMGIAAHWAYKEEPKRHDGRQYAWLRHILEILDHVEEAEEFLEHTKLEMYQDQVFCFTPKGELIALPKGATTVDFAYAIHSSIGNHIIGAKINGRSVPLRTEIHNGDQLEVLTSQKQTPSPMWERFVVTGKARAAIRRFIRYQQRDQFIQLGQSLLSKTFRKAKVPFKEKDFDELLQTWKLNSLDDLYAMIGEGRLHTSREVLEFVTRHQKTALSVVNVLSNLSEKIIGKPRRKKLEPKKESVSIAGLIPGMAIHYAGCCHPIRGDKIVGVVITGTGVTLHTHDCEQLKNVDPTSIIELDWGNKKDEAYVARTRITFINQKGIMAQITNMISHNEGNIINMKVVYRSQEFWDIIIDISVQNIDHLQRILGTIRSLALVTRAIRG